MITDFIIFVLLMIASFFLAGVPILGIAWYVFLAIQFFIGINVWTFWIFFIVSSFGSFISVLLKVRISRPNIIAEITIFLLCGFFSLCNLNIVPVIITGSIMILILVVEKPIRNHLEGRCINIIGIDFCILGEDKN